MTFSLSDLLLARREFRRKAPQLSQGCALAPGVACSMPGAQYNVWQRRRQVVCQAPPPRVIGETPGEMPMFLRNYWYVAASERRDRPQAARPHDSRRAYRVLPHRGWRTGGARRPMCAPASAALDGQARRRHAAMSLSRSCALAPTAVACAFPVRSTFRKAAKVRTYPVAERYHWLWIWMGDPALADPAAITDFHWLDDPRLGRQKLVLARRCELAARRRQSARSDASGVRARDHDRQLSRLRSTPRSRSPAHPTMWS